MDDVVSLVNERLVRMGGALELDGRLTWYPRDARGFAPANVYLLREASHALLVDTGLPYLELKVRSQLRRLVPSDVRLSILPTRAAEFDSIGNVAAVLAGFPTRRVYSQSMMDLHRVVAFQPRFALPPAETDSSWPEDDALDWVPFDPGDTIEWAPEHSVEAVRTPLRLLITVWPFDPLTRTLFTSDAFNHVVRSSPTDPAVMAENEADPTTVEDVMRQLDNGKFDWLAGADTTQIRSGIEAIFDSRAVERIAPAYGCVLEGRRTVDRHVELLLEALMRLSTAPGAVVA